MPKPQLTDQEWSHFFDVEDIDKTKPTRLVIEASEEECVDLARRFGVESIRQVKADLEIGLEAGHIIHITGEFLCDIVQKCVITLEPINTILKEPVEGWFSDKETTVSFKTAKREREITHSNVEIEMMEERDDPEPVLDGRIDLGELVSQHISLTIPAYPHKEGAAYEIGDENFKLDDKSPLRKNPFEALKDWKEKQ